MEYDVAFGLENHAVSHDKMKAIVIQSLDNVDMKEYMEYEPHFYREAKSNAWLLQES